MSAIDNAADHDLVVTINRAVAKFKDDVFKDIADIETWVNSIIIQTPKQATVKKSFCEICSSKEDADLLERHPIAGEKHDYRAVTACENRCHRQLTMHQHLWDERWRKHYQPNKAKQMFLLLGLREVLLLKGERTGNSNYRRLGDALAWDISELVGGRKKG